MNVTRCRPALGSSAGDHRHANRRGAACGPDGGTSDQRDPAGGISTTRQWAKGRSGRVQPTHLGAFLLLICLIAASSPVPVLAGQEPVAGPVATPIGGDGGVLRVSLERTAGGPLELQLLRIELEPGARSPLHAHPGLELGWVETGTLAVLVNGDAVLLSAEAAERGGPAPVVPEGIEVYLRPGDRIAYAPGTRMTFRNPGRTPTRLLAATVLPAGPTAPPGVIYAGEPPAADDLAGIRSQVFGAGIAPDLPLGRATVDLQRLVLRPGDAIPAFPGPALVAAAEGAVSGRLRAEPAAPATDGEPFTLDQGPAAFFPDGMAESPPLTGTGEVVLLRLGILPLGEQAGADAAMAPAPPGDQVLVVVEARLRAAPSLDAPVLAGLAPGQVLVVTGVPIEADGLVWVPVAAADDPSLVGFVAADLLAPVG